MESKFLSDDQIEWEARRVAAAFDTEMLEEPGLKVGSCLTFTGCTEDGSTAFWSLDRRDLRLNFFRAFIDESNCGEIGCDELFGWSCYPALDYNELLARGLYRLGIDIEDEELLAPLNVSLTAHEKLELRLSMPREFWPQTWLDEASEK